MDKRYLKIYSSQNDYNNNWLNDLEVPHVVYIEETDEVIFKDAEPKVDYSTQYFTLEALENGTMEIAMPNSFSSFKYAHNDGDWIQTNDAISLNVNPNDTVKIACVTDNWILGCSNPINCTCKFNVYGNAMSLLYGDNFEGQIDLSGKDNAFDGLFRYCTTLQNAENLILPATTLAKACYSYMFANCTSLTTVPELPATTLTSSCYESMFEGCSSLTTAPELPATTLANWCYNNMFSNCTSLTTAPELPATTLADHCYQGMFYRCTSLTTALELPATRLANWCYQDMFNGCSKLNYIKMLATIISASNCLYNWVNGVASSGTFVKNINATWNVTGNNGIPNGWTVETA